LQLLFTKITANYLAQSEQTSEQLGRGILPASSQQKIIGERKMQKLIGKILA
jgi:hypothetical protein